MNDFSQINKLAVDIGKVTAEAQALASVAVRKTLFDIEADAKAIIVEKHIIDTGDLLNSVSTEVKAGGLGGEVGPTVDYGIYQEVGTSTQPGRPYMGPAFDRRAPMFETMLSRIADGLT